MMDYRLGKIERGEVPPSTKEMLALGAYLHYIPKKINRPRPNKRPVEVTEKPKSMLRFPTAVEKFGIPKKRMCLAIRKGEVKAEMWVRQPRVGMRNSLWVSTEDVKQLKKRLMERG
jgi:hypothetical protein